MNATVLNNENIVRSFEEILISLSEKEKNVIERRVWLKWEKEKNLELEKFEEL